MKLNKKSVFIFVLSLTTVALRLSQVAEAASATGTAVQTVIKALSLSALTELNFGEAPQGDAAKVVAPGTAPTGENASFKVVGEKGRAYTIQLPADGIVKMSTAGGGSPDKEISVNSFNSFPANSGSLDPSTGEQTLFVGATRSALSGSQEPGSYSGTFQVTVIY